MRKIIAFTGRAGSGKDYQCNLLVDKGYKKLAFADALRKIACATLNLSYDESMKIYDSLKTQDCVVVYPNPNKSKCIYLNFRQILENLGTQGIRHYDNDFWARCLVKEIDESTEDICISDLRFINEYNYIKKYCEHKNYEFKLIYCDYHSNRYQYINPHESAKLSNILFELKYNDLSEITEEDIIKVNEYENKFRG